MKQENNISFGAWAFIIAIIAATLFLYGYQTKINNFKNYIISLNLWVYPIVLGIFIVLFLLAYILVKIIKAGYYRITYLKNEARRIQNEIIEIENLTSKKLKFDEQELTSNIERIKQKVNICKSNKKLFCFIYKLKKQLAKATELLELLEKEKKIKDLHNKKIEIEKEIQKLEKQKKEKLYQEEQDKRVILKKLNASDNNVFKKEELTEKEISALLENGCSQINEYCVDEQKLISVLVKPILNHSKTHIFLVWSVKKLLEKNKDIFYIKEHLTKDADITFYYKGKRFALEIETGTLLEKSKQLQEKLNYLNRKYKNRWMLIVSNMDLVPRYRKFGFATQRKWVQENLNKLLKNVDPK